MTKHFQNIATTLKTYRLKANVSQSELSTALGYKNGQFISNVERGVNGIPDFKLVSCANALNMDYGILIDAVLEDSKYTLVKACEKQVSTLEVSKPTVKKRPVSFTDFL